MNTQPSRCTFALRQRPLALCLACALGIGTAGSTTATDRAAAGASAVPPLSPRQRITGPADLPVGSIRRVAWEALLANAPPPRPAATIPVTNCNDSGAGSLRDAMAVAVDGDTIDMTMLSCSTITLTTGALSTVATNLTLDGPKYGIEIDAYGNSSNIIHAGSGTLYLNRIGVTNGYYYGSAAVGGCILSFGSVSLSYSSVTDCTAKYAASSSTVKGGGVYAKYDVALDHSVVSDSGAVNVASTYGYAVGGGIYAGGSFYSRYSSVLDNRAYSSTGYAWGGGVWSSGVGIKYSTLAGNYASLNIGALVIDAPSSALNTIANSTISGNSAGNAIGGVFSAVPLIVTNSTIAFNDQGNTGSYGYSTGAGLTLAGGAATLSLTSSIIAGNYDAASGKYLDLGADPSVVVSGSNNLLTGSLIPVPADTIYADPQLAPLADNGGLTMTHALGSSSPALHTGTSSKYYDQRGPGYPRVVGANADIGAFELNVNDIIFADGFD